MAPPVYITFLGGLGEIGRNCAALEVEDQILLIDCGLMFPDSDMLGIDVVLPDFTWLRERLDSIVGCVLTHGHEDHVGALSYLLADASFPLYGSPLTLGLARARIEEAGLMRRTSLNPMADGESVQIGPFGVQFVPMTHSVPQGMGLIITTPQGALVHTGDFKLDLTPVDGRRSDLSRLGTVASTTGVRLLMSDSTNADHPGFTRSERAVGEVIYDLMHRYRGRRLITACFASHLHRVQQIADAARELGRKVSPLGRSMHRNIALGRELGILDLPESAVVDIEDVDSLDPGEVCVISTGSQGEAMSALALLAEGESRWLKAMEGDVVMLSSHPIPGNEHNVNRVIDSLTRLGVEVVHSGIADVHATGHAQQEELKLIISLMNPEWFVPVHGEYTHMVHHAHLAAKMGVAEDHILVAEDGDRLVLDDAGLRRSSRVPAEFVYVDGAFVDGTSVGEVGRSVLRDRHSLASDGVVTAVVCVDTDRREIVSGPLVVSRGWVHEAESEELIEQARTRVAEAVEAALRNGTCDRDGLQKVVRKAAGSFVSESTRRRPMIVPVVLTA